MSDDVTLAVRAVVATYDAGDDLDVPMLSLKLALSEQERARFRDEANRYWIEASALRAQLDDALTTLAHRAHDAAEWEADRFNYAAAIEAHRDKIAELERMVGEREGRIGGLEYDAGAAAVEAEAQRARIAELEAERDQLVARVATLEAERDAAIPRIAALEARAVAPPPPADPLPPGVRVAMPGRLAGAAKAAEVITRAIDAPLEPCPHCDQKTFKSQISRTQHVNYCPKNPNRLLAPQSKAARDAKRAAAADPAPPEQPAPDAEPVVQGAVYCQFCRAPFSPKRKELEQHEPRCPENPNRIAPPDLVRQITLSVDASEVYTCPECKGTAFAKALRHDRCVNCDNKARIGKAAA